jgi:hypothetical protein
VLVLKTYLDETGDEYDPNVFICGFGGCIAEAGTWKTTKSWQGFRVMKKRIESKNSHGVFNRERACGKSYGCVKYVNADLSTSWLAATHPRSRKTRNLGKLPKTRLV